MASDIAAELGSGERLGKLVADNKGVTTKHPMQIVSESTSRSQHTLETSKETSSNPSEQSCV